MDLRHFLTIGMLLSGLMSVFFGLGYFWKLHNFAYFVTIQVIIMQQIFIPGMFVLYLLMLIYVSLTLSIMATQQLHVY